jgi:glycosyltransferase involved in cell wall biosynthesis
MLSSADQANIVALIPAFNEAAAIASVVKETLAFLPVIVVDDGSADATVRLAEEAGAVVLRQIPNQGKGAALRRGFSYALEKGYEAVITLDADGQHDPKEIPLFIECYRKTQARLIIGSREYSQMPFPRSFSNTIGRAMVSWALGQYVADNQSGYRLIHRDLCESMLTSTEQSFEFEVEMVAKCIRPGWKLESVPIRTIYAGEKSHISYLRHIVNFFRITWKIRTPRNKK